MTQEKVLEKLRFDTEPRGLSIHTQEEYLTKVKAFQNHFGKPATEIGNEKFLGAKIGHTSVLHTWGQNLMHHPHVHCIVPGSGLNSLGKWVNSRKKFFIPVKVLSRKFRASIYFISNSFMIKTN